MRVLRNSSAILRRGGSSDSLYPQARRRVERCCGYRFGAVTYEAFDPPAPGSNVLIFILDPAFHFLLDARYIVLLPYLC
jgi:hypothetical protein